MDEVKFHCRIMLIFNCQINEMFIFILPIRKEQQIKVWRKEIMTISSFSSTSPYKALKKNQFNHSSQKRDRWHLKCLRSGQQASQALQREALR